MDVPHQRGNAWTRILRVVIDPALVSMRPASE
jgi:hypothetical protein